MSQNFYGYLVAILPGSNFSIEKLSQNLKRFFSNKNVKIKSSTKQITLNFDEKYNFYICLNDEDYVIQESQEMAEYNKLDFNKKPFDKKQLSQSNQRLEIWADEDYNMEYFNESLFIIETIEKFEKVVIFEN